MATRDSGEGGSSSSHSNNPRLKRQTVTSACETCRRTKTKCDGQRPCTRCRRQNRECVYAVYPNETHQQAVKRKYDDLLRSHNDFEELYQVLASTDQAEAEDIVRQVRQGRSADSILQQHRRAQTVQQRSLTHSHEQRRRRSFILALVQSTAPLPDLLRLARSVLSPKSRVSLPPEEAWRPFQDRIVTLETLSGVLSGSESQQRATTNDSEQDPLFDESYDDRLRWIPAAPWVYLPDAAFSHLVSAFLSLSNAYWRFVESDLFLKALRSKDLDSEYCSLLLVNAILALGSMFCEIDAAFTVPGDFLTRGEQYHNEAIRLWTLEQGRASLVNLQALMILGVESGIRGQDRLGTTFISQAFTMNNSLPSPTVIETDEQGSLGYSRARQCIAWTMHWVDGVFGMCVFRPTTARPELLPAFSALDHILPDTIRHWSPFPFEGSPVPMQLNMLTRLRSRMARYVCEFTHLFFSDQDRPIALVLWQTAQPLAARIRDWYEALPREFQYASQMPPWMFEFHGQYFCLMMTLYSKCAEAFLASDGPDNAYEGLASDLYDAALRYAFRAATAARDYRATYGLKIIPPGFMQQSAVACFTLLHELKRRPIDPEAESRADVYPIADSFTAFEECFRCLLGCGLQHLVPRAISRAVYNTATVLHVRLPKAVIQALEVAGSAAWQASDVLQLNSDYPALTLMRDLDIHAANDTLEDLLRKWEALGLRDRASFQQASDLEGDD